MKEEKIKGKRKLKVGEKILIENPYHIEISKVKEVKENVAILENNIQLVASYNKKDKILIGRNTQSYSLLNFYLYDKDEKAQFIYEKWILQRDLKLKIKELESQIEKVKELEYSKENVILLLREIGRLFPSKE